MFVPCAVLLALLATTAQSARTWTCEDGKCVKGNVDDAATSVSVDECKVTCLEHGGLWPKPTGETTVGKTLVTVRPSATTFRNINVNAKSEGLLMKMQEQFIKDIKKLKGGAKSKMADDTVYSLNVTTEVEDPDVTVFTEGANESFELTITAPEPGSTTIEVTITANNILGVRHGFVTLAQLVVIDDIRGRLRLVKEASIKDKPVYTHRGISLDTARTYISPGMISLILTFMGQNKLNTFHWHMTDSHSFPYVSQAYPQLSEEGAYYNYQVYSADTIRSLVEYAQVFGIRVVPEFDAPAHVGEGWHALDKDLVTCFRWEPWTNYCVEPPCGQFDPTNEKVYEILGTIFKEYVELFNADLFHMGGDEVNLNCWRSTPRIANWMAVNNYTTVGDEGFMELWNRYQEKTLAALRKANHGGKAMLWSSTLTDEAHLTKYLKPEDYIIQIWSSKSDKGIPHYVNNNFSVIFSNYDELYFDCGGGAWIGGPGQNWCSPYIGWQSVYEHSPSKILESLGVTVTDSVRKLVLGSEAALWTEQVHDSTVLGRLFPRASALAERLWSDPSEDWTAAQYRMNHHKERQAIGEQLQPTWCYQNDGYCGLGV